MTLARRCTAFLFATTATLLLATAAAADLVPILDLRQLHVKAVYEGEPQEFTAFPFANFGAWNWYEVAQADGAEAGHASATAFQISQLSRDGIGTPTGFYHSGGTNGEFQVGVGSYEALSLSTMVFQLTTTSDFFIDATLDPGDAGSQGEIVLGNPHGAPHLFEVNSGHVMLNGRLGPGDYFIEGRSQVSTLGPSLFGPTYAIIMTIQPTSAPVIQLQPSDIVIPSGGDASLSVTTNSPAPQAEQEATAALTFQWRKNRVPLANGGHYSGVATNTLSITNAAMADTGWYDVLVTSGEVQEPSRYARVTVGITGVEPVVPGASLDFRLEGAAPNPSASITSFRFTAARPVNVEAYVYDASGRRVRRLPGGSISGSGALKWDGVAEGGERAPAGIYFLRVRVEGETHVRRFVRMRS